jgi:hypothetical protein
MSFVLSYHRLFKVSVLEGGSGSVLSDLLFQPTASSLLKLKNHNLIFRAREEGFEVFYQMNPLNPQPILSRINDRIQFCFAIYQTEADFFKHYKPDLNKDSGPQLYFDNLTSKGRLQNKATLTVSNFVKIDDAVKVYPKVFNAHIDLAGGGPIPTKFRVKERFNPKNVVLAVPIKASANVKRASAQINLSGQPTGPYTLETDISALASKSIYIDNELAECNVSGLVDIHWETPQDAVPSGGVAYEIRFQKK